MLEILTALPDNISRLVNQAVKLVLIGVGIVTVAVALYLPELRQADGWLGYNAWAMALAGVALVLIGLLYSTVWQRFSLAFSLAMLGQTTALALIFSPSYNILEHYYTWHSVLASGRLLFLIGPAAQSSVVVYFGWRYRLSILDAVRKTLGVAQISIAGGLVLFGLANISFDVSRYLGELVLAGWIVTVNAAGIAIVAFSIPRDSLPGLQEKTCLLFRRLDRRLPWIMAAWVLTASSILSLLVLDGLPHISDAVSYLHQAKYFAAGLLYLPVPPDALAFDYEKFHNDGSRFWSYGFPGWPAALSLGVLAGIPWIVNPLLAAGTIILTHFTVSKLYNRRLAHLVVLLLAVSPWFLVMSATFMAHALTAAWAIAALAAIIKARDSMPLLWGTLAGASLAGLLLTRPLEGVLIGCAIGIWLLVKDRRRAILPLLSLAVGGIVVGQLFFAYNNALTGSPFLTPHQVMTDARYYPGADRLGFGSDVGAYGWRHLDPLSGHGPIDVVLNIQMNYYMSNFELFGWAFGSMSFVALLLLWRKAGINDALFLLIIGVVVVGHTPFWFSGGPDIGARYWYQLLIPFTVLTARGMMELQSRWARTGGSSAGATRIWVFVASASLIALLVFLPWRSIVKYHNYLGLNTEIAELVYSPTFDNSVIFVAEEGPEDYARALLLNSPILESGRVILARDLGSESRAVIMQEYPDRKPWIARHAFPGGPFEIVEAQ